MTSSISSKARFLISTALTATGLIAMATSPAFADNWTDLQGDGFSTDITVPDTTNITQHLDVVKARGDLDITENHTVNILQPGSTSLFAAYDIEGDPTYILGRLNANGQVLVIDQNGVFFGRNSVVNVGSIIATTAHINEADLDDRTFTAFNNGGNGAIKLEGLINVAEAGIAAFVSPSVQNSGVINAKLGKVAFAAGEKVTLDLYGDDLVNIAVDDKLGDALIENSGVIKAEGGTVQLTANAAKNAVDNVINMDGVIDVSSVTVKGGKIILGGGSKGAVKVSGKMKADGKNGGGEIDVTGENVYVDTSALLSANALEDGNGGIVNVIAADHADFRGTILARGGANSGNGGAAEVSGYGALGFNGFVDLSAAKGVAGNLLLDPEWAVIHSGSLNNPLGLGYVLSAQALANSMETGTTITVQADNWIDVGTRNTSYNTGNAVVDAILNALVGVGDIDLSTFDYNTWGVTSTYQYWFFGWHTGYNYGWINHAGTTQSDIRFLSNTVNFNKDLIMGDGDVIVDAATVNLNGLLLEKDYSTLLGDARITSIADIVNVESNKASIQQGVWLTKDAGGVVNIAADTYQEQIIIDRDVSLIGEDRDTTIIQSPTQLAQTNTSPHGARNYGVIWAHDADVNISGLTIDGSTNAQAGGYDDNNRFIGVIYQNAGGTFENNHITNINTAGNNTRSGFGFLTTDDEGATSVLNVIGNVIDGFQSFGIALANSKLNATLKDNEITGDKDNIVAEQTGIYVTTGAKVTAGGPNSGEGNAISNTDTGVHVTGSANGHYESNTLSNVHNGFVISNSSNTSLLNNTIGGNSTTGVTILNSNGSSVVGGSIDNFDYGVDVDNSDDVTIDGVTFTNIAETHIDIADSDNATVQKNTMTGGKTGVMLTNVTNSTVGGADASFANIINDIVGGWTNTGINVKGGSGLIISYNDLNNIGGQGIYAEGPWAGPVSNLEIMGNDIDGTEHNAIYLKKWNTANIASNNIDGTTYGHGVQLELTNNVDVTGNEILNVAGHGVNVWYGNNSFEVDGNEIGSADKGIFVDTGNTLGSIDGNTVYDTLEQGIHILGGVTFANNNIVHDTGSHGIDVANTPSIVLRGNKIGFEEDIFNPGTYVSAGVDNVKGDGIRVEGSDGVQIKGNLITETHSAIDNTGSGIQVLSSSNAVIGGAGADENIITNARWDGIRLNGSDNAQIRNNDIDGVGRTGIYAESSTGFLANNNEIDDAGRDGIYINGVNDAAITNNNIGTNGGANNIGQWGVHVTNGRNVDVTGNRIFDTVWDGILASGVRTASGDTYAIRIVDNDVRRADDNGIRIINLRDDAGVQGNGRALVRDNFVRYTGDNGVMVVNSEVQAVSNILNNVGISGLGNGIRLEQSDNSVLNLNEIGLLGNAGNINGDGIYAEFSDSLTINRNTIANTAHLSSDIGSGIQLYRVNGATIARNIITDSDWDGIRLESVKNVTVRRNEIDRIVRTGSYAEFSDNVDYDRNVIDNVGRDGIFVYGTTNSSILSNRIGTNGGAGNIGQWGVHITNGSNIAVDSNRIFDAHDGIIVSGTSVGAGLYATTITDNVIRRSAQHGIEMRNAGDSLITGNNIVNSGAVGILASRGGNGQFTIADNTVRLFDVAMQFESGIIDLTGVANTIENGTTGMVFRPYALGGGAFAPLSLVENDAIGTSTPFVPGVAPTDYAGTLGDTIFENISGQYVELDNLAFWDFVNGVPLWIDARSATYDGIRPIDFPGAILDPVTYGLIEDKLFHFPDTGNTGVFFFGSLLGPDIDESQFLRTFAGFNGDATGLNIRILGLPSTGVGPAPGGLAGTLNNIGPFAGGTNPAALNQIETAAGGPDGQQGDNPAEIEPAAGGDESAACWGDALNVAQTGQAVNVVYGASLDDALTSAAACSDGTI